MSDLPAMTFGQFIRNKREELGYSVAEAAHKTKSFAGSIRKWEADESRPFMSSIKKIAIGYELPLQDLVQFDLKHISHKEKPPVERIRAEIRASRVVIIRTMTGESQFESNMRNKLLAVLDKCEELLEPVQFLDSAF